MEGTSQSVHPSCEGEIGVGEGATDQVCSMGAHVAAFVVSVDG